MARIFLVLSLCVLLTACFEGTTVDKEAPSFVDRESAPLPDQKPTEVDTVVHENESSFVPLPVNETNRSLSDDERYRFRGKDVVRLYVWNELGSQQLLMAEGTAASVAKLRVNVQVAAIGEDDGGEVKLYVNSKPARTLNAREETKVDNTWIFVSEIIVVSE